MKIIKKLEKMREREESSSEHETWNLGEKY